MIEWFVYHGSDQSLLGKTALGRILDDSQVWVFQFDDTKTGFGYSWYAFDRNEFTQYPETVIGSNTEWIKNARAAPSAQ